MKALEKDDQNVYAVIGLTNTIAEHGLVSESQKLYKLVQDMNPQIPHTYVNLAHLHASEGNSSSAITLYQKCIDEFYPKSGNKEIELWICRIYYLENDFEKSKKRLLKLINRHPEDMILQFNLALTL